MMTAMNTMIIRASLAACASLASAALGSAQGSVPSIRDALAGDFTLGAAVSPEFTDAADRHAALIARQFGALVCENAMKPESLQPVEGTFRFAPADRVLRFAERNGMALRGHALVWHQQTPQWFFSDSDDRAKAASRELLLRRLETHIQTVLGHYRGRIRAWDVVNEVLGDDGRLRDARGGSKWYEIIGPDYVDKAFNYAREADPAALLAINDYNLESSAAKRDAMYDLVKGLLSRGVPVGAVGMQMHVSIYGPGLDEIRQAIEKFASLGVKVQVTELDVSVYAGKEAEKPITADLLDQQAKRYAELFGLFREEAKKGNLDMVMLWGVSDEQSWLNSFPVPGRTNAPLLFDRELEPKPAFWAIVGTNINSTLIKK